MHWTDQINRVAGISLLLLALGIILSIVFTEGITSADPFQRDEVAEYLSDINDNEGLAIGLTIADVATDAAIGIVAAAMAYVVFRERNRLLALFSFVLLFAGSVAFMAGDAANVSLIVLAEDFVEKGGPGGIAAGDDVILETARAVAVWSFVIDQIAITAIAFGLISLGVLIAWTPAGAGPVPPRWLGGLAVIAGLATVLSWIGAAAEGVGIALFLIGGIATLIFLIVLGVWLLMQTGAGEGQRASAAM